MTKNNKEGTPKDEREAFEKASIDPEKKNYVLRLFVTGTTPKSIRAISNIKEICDLCIISPFSEEEIKNIYQ